MKMLNNFIGFFRLTNNEKVIFEGEILQENIQRAIYLLLIAISASAIPIIIFSIKLFDISQPVSTTGTEQESGTGLGLFFCKEFGEKHGGKIWVESEERKGPYFISPFRCIRH